jgi:hypothetical protein
MEVLLRYWFSLTGNESTRTTTITEPRADRGPQAGSPLGVVGSDRMLALNSSGRVPFAKQIKYFKMTL